MREIVERMERIAGTDAVTVRGFIDDGDPFALVRDFLTTVGLTHTRTALETRSQASFENRRLTTGDAIRRFAANTALRTSRDDIESRCAELLAAAPENADLPFTPMTQAEALAVSASFAEDAAWLLRTRGLDITAFRHERIVDSPERLRSRALFAGCERICADGS